MFEICKEKFFGASPKNPESGLWSNGKQYVLQKLRAGLVLATHKRKAWLVGIKYGGTGFPTLRNSGPNYGILNMRKVGTVKTLSSFLKISQGCTFGTKHGKGKVWFKISAFDR